MLRFYGAKGCHQKPDDGQDDVEPAIGTGKSFVLTRGGAFHNIHGDLLSEDSDVSEFDEPFDKALRAFVKVERQLESVSDTTRKVSGIGHDDVTRSHRTASYRVPDTNPFNPLDGAPWDNISAQLQKEVNAVLELLKLGSAGNHAPSQNLLGTIHLHGYGASRFEAHGLSLVQHAVDVGNTSALHNMGRLHLLGHGAVHHDKGRAARLFRRAANQGSVESQRVLGHLYHSGVGVVENLVTAAHYWEMAASAGDADAQYHLGLMCSIGKGVHQDDAKAMELWLSAAHGGSAEAEFHLGSLHERGVHGVHKDDHQAWLLYKAAAEKGHAMAQYHAGVMRLEGRGADGVPNDPKAVEYFELAAENGLSRAQFNLGILMLEGRGGGVGEASGSQKALEAADQRARELFAEAAKQGLGEAQCSLAWMYVNSRGVRPDPSLTRPQREAARARDEAKALGLYRAAAEQGIAEALFHLGLMYFRGVGVEKDEPVGMDYVMQAAFKGHSEAQYELGLMRVLLGRSGANRETAKRRPVPNKMGDYDGDADGYDDHSRRPPPPPPPPGSPRGGRGSPADDLDDIPPDAVLDESAADEQEGEKAELENEKEELKAEEEEKDDESDESDESDDDDDPEDAEPIEDWLNAIQDSYGDKYNGIFRSSGYETREKLERDCGDVDVVDELLEKLESKSAAIVYWIPVPFALIDIAFRSKSYAYEGLLFLFVANIGCQVRVPSVLKSGAFAKPSRNSAKAVMGNRKRRLSRVLLDMDLSSARPASSAARLTVARLVARPVARPAAVRVAWATNIPRRERKVAKRRQENPIVFRRAVNHLVSLWESHPNPYRAMRSRRSQPSILRNTRRKSRRKWFRFRATRGLGSRLLFHSSSNSEFSENAATFGFLVSHGAWASAFSYISDDVPLEKVIKWIRATSRVAAW